MTKEFTSATDAAGPLGSASSDGLGPLPEPHDPPVFGYTSADMRSYAAQQVAAERKRWETVVFDGWRVLKGLDAAAAKRTTHQNVSDTLDALMRVLRV